MTPATKAPPGVSLVAGFLIMGGPMSPELSATVQTLLLIVLPALAGALVLWGVNQATQAYARWKAEQPDKAAILESAVTMVVKAAEQNGLVKKLADEAFNKKDFALYTANAYLKAQGVNIDLHLIDAAIEAKVIELFPRPPAA